MTSDGAVSRHRRNKVAAATAEANSDTSLNGNVYGLFATETFTLVEPRVCRTINSDSLRTKVPCRRVVAAVGL